MYSPAFPENEQPATPSEEQLKVPQGLVDHRHKMNAQIARLQERQLALILETTAELDQLRDQLSSGSELEDQVQSARQPLLATIASLQAEKEQLANSLASVQRENQNNFARIQSILNLADEPVAVPEPLPPLPQYGGSIQSATEAGIPPARIPIILPIQTSVPAPVSEPVPQADPVIAPVETPVAELQSDKAAKKEKPAKEARLRPKRRVKKFVFRLAVLALALTGGWKGLKAVQQKNIAASGGDVAGASTTAPSAKATADPADQYKESRAAIPFNLTEWQTYTDTDFGFTIHYPSNTSNKVKTIGGDNIWFLRFDGYLMKFSKEETPNVLDEWWQKSAGFYADGNTTAKGVFKGHQAWIVTPTEKTATSGVTYIIGTKYGILQIWVKDEDPTTADGQRIAKMVDSLTITN